MLCSNCGTENNTTNSFCENCGAPLNNPSSAEHAAALRNEPSVMPDARPPKSSRKRLWIILAIIAAVLIAAALSLRSIVTAVWPEYAIARASLRTFSLLEKRLDKSPLIVVPTLMQCLEDGTVQTAFLYDDSNATTISGDIALLRSRADNAMGLTVHTILDETGLDLTVLANDERLAFNASFIGDDYYGITYETFDTDVDQFAPEIGLDTESIDALKEIFQRLAERNTPASDETGDLHLALIDHINDMLNAERTVERITTSGKTVNCTKLTYTFTQDDIAAILETAKTDLANDDNASNLENYAAFYKLILTQSYGYPQDNDVEAAMDELIEDIRNSDIDIQISYYLRSGRLVRIAFTMDANMLEVQTSSMSAYVDFGLMPNTDDLTLGYTDESDHVTLTVSSAYDQAEITETFTLVNGNDDDEKQGLLSILWNTDSGDIRITTQTPDLRDAEALPSESHTLLGNLATSDDGFTLDFDDVLDGTSNFALRIEAARIVSIPAPAYINLDAWGPEFVEKATVGAQELIAELFFGM